LVVEDHREVLLNEEARAAWARSAEVRVRVENLTRLEGVRPVDPGRAALSIARSRRSKATFASLVKW
jgi:hypothetical protein